MMEFCQDNSYIISDALNRLLTCMQLDELCIYGEIQSELCALHSYIQQVQLPNLDVCAQGCFLYSRIATKGEAEKLLLWIEKNRNQNDFFIYFDNDELLNDPSFREVGTVYPLKPFSSLPGGVLLLGKTLDAPKKNCVPDSFRVLAIVHFYNEADVLGKTVEHLLSQDVDVYLVDNWSTDGSYEIARKCADAYPDHIFLERFPFTGATNSYQWFEQLERTEAISKSMHYDWYIHYDADEIRISPWKGRTLREMLYKADQLGYCLVEDTVIEHKLTSAEQQNIFAKDTYFAFGHRKAHFLQKKTWKRSSQIELKSSGGHCAVVPNPKVFPLKNLNRHYPLRETEQAMRKVLVDRQPRFAKENAERGWHVHYAHIKGINDILGKERDLLLWDHETIRNYYIPLFLGCGIYIDYGVPAIRNQRIIIYGAGQIGHTLYYEYSKINHIVAWVDTNFESVQSIYGLVQSPDVIRNMEFDFVVIAIKSPMIQAEVKAQLLAYGVEEEKIRGV